MNKTSKQDDWLDSKEARMELEVSACDLSHIREAGKLRYRKEGKAFRYSKSDIQKVKRATAKEIQEED